MAFHWYSGSCFHHVSQVVEKHSTKIVLPSEACYELTQADDDMSEDRSRQLYNNGEQTKNPCSHVTPHTPPHLL